ncbi:FixH family protein [Metabacillus herbersteinensis]|uniref:FixH family protein n=1 Tax=Metabacillus herbersteinensis TaxID=283816 RepID=A0ABV6GKN4_9BACI
MDKFIGRFILLTFLSALVACGQNNENSTSAEQEVKAPRAEIISKEHVNKEEEVHIQAKVYYGEELADDANVMFEIKNGDESTEIDADLEDKGTYAIHHQFKEDGLYQVIAHTDVENYHTMPSKEIQVGEVAVNGEEKHQSEKDNEEHHHGEGSESAQQNHQHDEATENEHHHVQKLTIMTGNTETFTTASTSTLSTIIEKENEAFADAKVRFEVWKKDEKNHQYLNAAESGDGEYSTEYTFDQVGVYTMVVHVEKGDIHEHKEITFEIIK